MNYKVLIFDADGTLFDFEQAEQQAFKQMLEERDIPFTDSLFQSYLQANKQVWNELEQGHITQEELKYKRFLGFLTLSKLEGQAKDMAISYMQYLSHASILYPNALELIKNLSKDYRVTILTNGLKEVQDRRIRKSILAPYIEDVVISDEIGIAKPDKAIIEHALKNIGHEDKASVMIIGDSLTSDIQGGINASITTVWLNVKKEKRTKNIQPDYEIHTLEELYEILN